MAHDFAMSNAAMRIPWENTIIERKKMKKFLLAIAGLTMALVLTGCSRSPSSVAEKFARALVQGDTDKAASYYLPDDMKPRELKNLKERIDKSSKKINDAQCEAESIYECINVKGEGSGYVIVNGKKFTESAIVMTQLVKGQDKKSTGIYVHLIKKDNSWAVVDFLCDEVKHLLWLREKIGADKDADK